jgi:peptidoglycan/xylan/chitin deacetylase (PgdA/CDA1 family)
MLKAFSNATLATQHRLDDSRPEIKACPRFIRTRRHSSGVASTLGVLPCGKIADPLALEGDRPAAMMTNWNEGAPDDSVSEDREGPRKRANPIIVTTSWDDGHPLDLRLAEMLRARVLPGTFFIPLAGPDGKPTLCPGDLRSLQAEGFEIGAHTVSHRTLAPLKGELLWTEVHRSKQVLEHMLGHKVSMFCYPKGSYNQRTIRAVEKAGFEGARTVQMLSRSLAFKRFEMPTTLQAYPHTPLTYLKNLGKQCNFLGLYRYVSDLHRCKNWVQLGKKLFDQVLREGGIWHLYGHSWELEDLNLWEQLAEMLDYVADRPGVAYVTNGQMLRQSSVQPQLPRLATA